MAKGLGSRVATWIKVGPKVVAIHFSSLMVDLPAHDLLAGDNPLRRDTLAVDPHRDTGLADVRASDLGQLLGQSLLPARHLDHPLEGCQDGRAVDLGVHVDPDNNTGSVISANTRSVIAFPDNLRMGRGGGKTSEFWVRLTRARTTCDPPKSMLQTDIATEYKVRQSAVTKWKTGGDKGSTKPEPEVVERMAQDLGCSFEWLWWGRGEMRPKYMDPITELAVEAMGELTTVEAKQEVVRAALAQRAMESPEVAARMRQAHREAERQIRNTNKKSG